MCEIKTRFSCSGLKSKNEFVSHTFNGSSFAVFAVNLRKPIKLRFFYVPSWASNVQTTSPPDSVPITDLLTLNYKVMPERANFILYVSVP